MERKILRARHRPRSGNQVRVHEVGLGQLIGGCVWTGDRPCQELHITMNLITATIDLRVFGGAGFVRCSHVEQLAPCAGECSSVVFDQLEKSLRDPMKNDERRTDKYPESRTPADRLLLNRGLNK